MRRLAVSLSLVLGGTLAALAPNAARELWVGQGRSRGAWRAQKDLRDHKADGKPERSFTEIE